MTTAPAWIDRVNDYLDTLEVCVEELNEILDNTRVGAVTVNIAQINDDTRRLSECLNELESHLAMRQQLLESNDAPLRGVTLRDVLLRCSLNGAGAVADRCLKVSQSFDTSRQRAIALFVCQFHLSELSTHLLALMRSGMDYGSTYKNGTTETQRVECHGSIFNRAA